MGTPYLFDNAVVDRHARLVNGIPVEGEFRDAVREYVAKQVQESDAMKRGAIEAVRRADGGA